MSLNDNALCSVNEVKDYLGLTKTDDDTFIEGLINAVSDFIENYCNRIFHDADHTEYHDGKGRDFLPVKNPPINSITSIYDDPDRDYAAGDLLDADDYVIDESEMFVQLDGITCNNGIKNIKITYNGGFATIPAHLKQAAIETVVRKYQEGKKNLLGIFSQAGVEGGSTGYLRDTLLPHVKMVLDQFRITPA